VGCIFNSVGLIITREILCTQGDSEISLEKKPVIDDDDEKSLTKHFSYKSFFVFVIQMIENLFKIASTLLS
jgi:hypothetical protein